MTQEQLNALAEKRMAYDTAINNGWDTNALTEYPAMCADLGLDILQAEEVTWPVIANWIYG